MKRVLIMGSFPALYSSELKFFARIFSEHACRRGVGVSTCIAWPDTFEEAVGALGKFQPDIVILCNFSFMRNGNGLQIARWIDDHLLSMRVCILNPPEALARPVFGSTRCAKVFRNDENNLEAFVDCCLDTQDIRAKVPSAA